jgi:hypothetical protein
MLPRSARDERDAAGKFAPRLQYRWVLMDNVFRLGRHPKALISSLDHFAGNFFPKQNQANNRQDRVSNVLLLSLVLKVPSKTAIRPKSEKRPREEDDEHFI